jgi:hypothetical protein
MEPPRKIVKDISSYFIKITPQQAAVQVKKVCLDLEIKELEKSSVEVEESKCEPKGNY